MKKLLIAVATAVTFVAPQAFAQAKNFEGFSAQAGLNSASSTIQETGTGFSNSATSTSSNFQLQADYTYAVTNAATVTVGASLGLGELKFARREITGVEIKLKNANALYVAPGYAINDKTLVYGKIASISGSVSDSPASYDINGMGYGLGVRILSSTNVYYQLEFMQNQYADKEFTSYTDKFKASVFNVGIGYKF